MGPNSACGASPDCKSRSSCAHRFRGVAGERRIDDLPSRLGAPSAAHLFHQLLVDLATRSGEQRQFGDFLIQEAEFPADDVNEHGGGVLRQLHLVTRLGPGDEPLDDPRLIDRFLLAALDHRCPALHLQPMFVHQLVQPRVGGPLRHVQQQYGPLLRALHVLFQPAAMVLHEIVGVLHHRQSHPGRVEQRRRTQLVADITPFDRRTVEMRRQHVLVGTNLPADLLPRQAA